MKGLCNLKARETVVNRMIENRFRHEKLQKQLDLSADSDILPVILQKYSPITTESI